MTIALLKPTAVFSDAGPNIVGGAITDIDEGVAGADGVLMDGRANGWNGGLPIEFTMEDLPGDADTITSVKLRIRANVDGGLIDDVAVWTWDINGIAMAGSIGWVQTEDGNGLVNKVFTATGSPTVANVNDALVRVDQTGFTQNMNPDGLQHHWDAFELEVDYTETTGHNITVEDAVANNLIDSVAISIDHNPVLEDAEANNLIDSVAVTHEHEPVVEDAEANNLIDDVTLPVACDELLAPDVVLEQVGLLGAVTDIDEPTSAPDANYMTAQ